MLLEIMVVNVSNMTIKRVESSRAIFLRISGYRIDK